MACLIMRVCLAVALFAGLMVVIGQTFFGAH